MSLRILILDASEAHRNVVLKFLYKMRPQAEVHQFDPSRSGRPSADFDWSGYQLIIMDTRLGNENGLGWFEQYSSSIANFPPVMFLSSENEVDVAVKAMKLGARDFLAKKDIKPQRFKQAIEEILPEETIHKDILPDLKPLPAQQDTMQYSAADTQILTRAELSSHINDDRQVVQEAEEPQGSYWSTKNYGEQHAADDTQVMPRVGMPDHEDERTVLDAANTDSLEQDDTMQYSGADTQILPEGAKANQEVVDLIEHDDDLEGDYWDEQTQILGKPAGWLDKK
ncbi:response regulator [Kaarinaea lacus]